MVERAQWGVLGGLLLVTALFALLLSPDGGRSTLDPRPSTFRATPSGTMALYLVLEELELPVARRVTPFVEGAPLPEAIALLAPTEGLSPAEVAALLGWLREGGRLLYAAGGADTLAVALGLVRVPAFADSLGAVGTAAAAAAAHPLVLDADSVYGFRHAFAGSSPGLREEGAVPLLRFSEDRVGAAIVPVGEGMVIAWSDVAPLANRAVDWSGAALVFARAARQLASAGGAIEFDEYHHGFSGGGSPAGAMAAFLGEAPAGRMLLQLAMAGAGLLLLLGSRFGAPIPPAPARRRSPLAHLNALAAAYRAGKARNRARHLLAAGLARRLGRRPPAAGSEAEFLGSLAGGPAARRAAGGSLLQAWETEGDEGLELLARRADEFVNERTKT